MDRKTNKFVRYKNDPANPNGLSSNNIWALYQDRQRDIWVGTIGGGVNKLDKLTNTFHSYQTTPSDPTLIAGRIHTILEDTKGSYWIGTETEGIHFFDKSQNKFIHFSQNEQDSTSLSNNGINALLEDSKGTIWVATNIGLNKYNDQNKSFEVYLEKDGLPSDIIIGILEDASGNLWLSTSNGLSRFNPASESFKNYTVADGLQGREFFQKSALKTSKGEMLFGGYEGFTMFHPDSIRDNKAIPPVVITNFNIFNKTVQGGIPGSILPNHILETKEITLSYKQSVITFQFAALNYTLPEKNQYAYKLEGFDKEWNYIGYKHEATYTNLDPREYIFRVKASNNDGVWNEKGISIQLIITPPFWKTGLFRVSGLLLAITFLYAGYQLKTYRMAVRNKGLERKVLERTQQIEYQKHEIESNRDSLKRLNEALEQKVEERTQELQASNEELRQTLEHAVGLNTKLSERENFLSSILEQTPVSTTITDAEGTAVRVNSAYLALFRIEAAEQMVGKYNIHRDQTFTSQPFYRDIQAVFKEGNIARFEVQYKWPDNRHIYLVITAFPIKDGEGRVIHAVVQHEDITQRKLAVEALKANEEQLRLITDALPVLITYINHEQRYRFSNKTYEEWYGVSQAEVYGKHLWEVIGQDTYSKIKDLIRRVLEGETIHEETWINYPEIGNRFVSIDYIPHFQEGKVLGYYALVSDITEQKKAQQALELALQELEQALKETHAKNEELKKTNVDLDNFVYMASHDLKSPITNLEGLSSLLTIRLERKLDETEAKMMAMISQSTARLKTTILDLTEITKVQKEIKQEVELVSFELLLQDIQASIDSLIADSQARIHYHLEVDKIQYARKNLRSILYNLLVNAIKYRSPDRSPVIEIHTRQVENAILLSVQDNGLGIAAHQLPKLFMMFKRLHTHVQGSGIGLYITKRIIENNGGHIQVESQLGKGTSFTVYFKIG